MVLLAGLGGRPGGDTSSLDVLVIDSYHPGFEWSDREIQGFREASGPGTRISVEYLDSKHFGQPALDTVFVREFSLKYGGKRPKVLLATDDYAFNFLKSWRDTIFPGIPVVFCGINNFKPSLLDRFPAATGVGERSRIEATLDLMSSLYPDTREIWVVTERSATGEGNRMRFDSIARARRGGPRLRFLDSTGAPTLEQLESHLTSLKPGSLVYWSEFYQDGRGLFVDPIIDLRRIVSRSKVPFFSHTALYLRAGAVGGVCNRGVQHGAQAARMVAKVLGGVPPESIPVEEDSSFAPLFSAQALDRFSLPDRSLPRGAIVEGRSNPIWVAYPVQTTVGIGGLLLMAALSSALARSLSRRRRTERALRESEDNLKSIFDALPDAIIVHDRTGRIETVNEGMIKLYRIPPGGWTRLSIADCSCPGASLDQAREQIDRCLHGERVLFEWRARRPFTGEEFDVEVALAKLRSQGVERVAAVVRDIGDRIRARQAMEQANQELERRVDERTRDLGQAYRELEAFSYSASHDLRAPLRGINGFARALEEDLAEVLTPETSDLLRRIRSGSERMGAIIDDLLRLSRISTVDLSRDRVDMRGLVDRIIEEMSEDSRSRVRWILGDLPACLGDVALLSHVWTNLVSNAVKYSAREKLPVVEIGFRETEGLGAYFVRDNGAGFDAAQATRLFEPFRRFHGADEFPGTGIGLAIVHRVVVRHGGKVWAESRPGEGATFRFSVGLSSG